MGSALEKQRERGLPAACALPPGGRTPLHTLTQSHSHSLSHAHTLTLRHARGIYETVKARLWPWLSVKTQQTRLNCSFLARKRSCSESGILVDYPPSHLWRDKWTALSGPLSRGLPAAFAPSLGCRTRLRRAAHFSPCRACFRISSFGFRVSDFGCRVPDLGFFVSGSDFGFTVQGLGFRERFGLRNSEFGIGVYGFGFRDGSGFTVSGFRPRISGFRLRVSGFGFRA